MLGTFKRKAEEKTTSGTAHAGLQSQYPHRGCLRFKRLRLFVFQAISWRLVRLHSFERLCSGAKKGTSERGECVTVENNTLLLIRLMLTDSLTVHSHLFTAGS